MRWKSYFFIWLFCFLTIGYGLDLNFDEDFKKVFINLEANSSDFEVSFHSDWMKSQLNLPSPREHFKNADKQTIQEIVSFLNHPNITIQRGAFVIIINYGSFYYEKAELLLECGILQKLNQRLLHKNQDRVTLALITRVFSGIIHPQTTNVIIESEALQSLISILPQINDDESLKEIIGNIRSLARDSNAEQRCILFTYSSKEIGILLDEKNEEIIYDSIRLLELLTKDGLNCETINFNNFDFFATQVVQKLGKFIVNKDSRIRGPVLSILSNIAKSDSNTAIFILYNSGIIKNYANILLQDDDTKVIEIGLKMIGLISEHNHLRGMIPNEVIPTIVNLFDHEIFEINIIAFKIAANIAGNEKISKLLIDAGVLKKLNKFIYDPSEHYNTVAAVMLVNFLHDAEYTPLIFDGGFIPHIIDWLKSEHELLRTAAIQAIINIVFHGNPQQLNSLIEMEMLAPLCACLQKEIKNVMSVIYQLLPKLDPQIRAIVCMKLEEYECMPQIRKIYETHENEKIRELAFETFSLCISNGPFCSKIHIKFEL